MLTHRPWLRLRSCCAAIERTSMIVDEPDVIVQYAIIIFGTAIVVAVLGSAMLRAWRGERR